MKVSASVKKNTLYVLGVTLCLSGAMEVVFALVGKWDLAVLFGNLLGAFAAVLNFFLMGLTVQRAVMLNAEDAKKLVRRSQALRFLMMIAFGVVGGLVPFFNVFATVIPFLFPRFGVLLYTLIHKDVREPDGNEPKTGSEEPVKEGGESNENC